MHIPHNSRNARPPQVRSVAVENGPVRPSRPSSLLIRASSIVRSYIRMTARLALAALALGAALVLAVTGLVALVIFQCRARKRRIRRRPRALSGESFACPGEGQARARPLGWITGQLRSAEYTAGAREEQPSSPCFATPPPAYTDTVPAVLTTAMSLTLPRALTDDHGLRPRALTLPGAGQGISPPILPSVAPSKSFLELLSAAGLRNSIQEVEEHAHLSGLKDCDIEKGYDNYADNGTAELEVVSSYASEIGDDDNHTQHEDCGWAFAHRRDGRVNRRESYQSSELAYLQDDVEEHQIQSQSDYGSNRYSRYAQVRSNTKESAVSVESDLLTRLTPEPMTPLTAEPGGLRTGWSFPGQETRDMPSFQRRYRASLTDPTPITLVLPPRPIRDRSTTLPPDGAILHHLVNPQYNPAAARSFKGHRRSKSSGSISSVSSTPPLAVGLGMVGLGLTLGATLQNGTGLRRLSLVPEEENTSSGSIQVPETVYIPTATRTRRDTHRRSQSMPVARPLLSLIPADPTLPHHRRSPSPTSSDTLTFSSARSSSPMFFSPLLSTPSTSGPETPVFSFPAASPHTRARSATIASVDTDLTIKIYYSAKGHGDPSRNSYFDNGTETVKFRLPRTAVFGELCIKVWEKLGVAVKLLMYEDMMVNGESDIEGEGSAKRREVGAQEWRDVCERAQSRVYFWAKDTEINIASP
ncbi:hypothetical protein CALVIDRAFT_81919 [Calocera viscosa TUFC12733]|uniref:Uncharacterized protein n=1 Tax=Calocera viscosa (strain TUFC12733) TaxID=1330018 RepID=A0A167N1B8_CALVF|nr:hypothetical protein CALVIDRAFT_81919 [Calocera viscosa TUFC12733]